MLNWNISRKNAVIGCKRTNFPGNVPETRTKNRKIRDGCKEKAFRQMFRKKRPPRRTNHHRCFLNSGIAKLDRIRDCGVFCFKIPEFAVKPSKKKRPISEMTSQKDPLSLVVHAKQIPEFLPKLFC